MEYSKSQHEVVAAVLGVEIFKYTERSCHPAIPTLFGLTKLIYYIYSHRLSEGYLFEMKNVPVEGGRRYEAIFSENDEMIFSTSYDSFVDVENIGTLFQVIILPPLSKLLDFIL